MIENWKDVVGYEGLYQVSDRGNVLSLNYRNNGYAKRLTPKRNSKGRLWVLLYRDGEKKPFLIHRLVAAAFIPNPEQFPEINHKDENPLNNSVENLEWCTRKYNVRYYFNKRSACKESIVRQGKQKQLAIIQETTSGQCGLVDKPTT